MESWDQAFVFVLCPTKFKRSLETILNIMSFNHKGS